MRISGRNSILWFLVILAGWVVCPCPALADTIDAAVQPARSLDPVMATAIALTSLSTESMSLPNAGYVVMLDAMSGNCRQRMHDAARLASDPRVYDEQFSILQPDVRAAFRVAPQLEVAFQSPVIPGGSFTVVLNDILPSLASGGSLVGAAPGDWRPSESFAVPRLHWMSAANDETFSRTRSISTVQLPEGRRPLQLSALLRGAPDEDPARRNYLQEQALRLVAQIGEAWLRRAAIPLKWSDFEQARTLPSDSLSSEQASWLKGLYARRRHYLEQQRLFSETVCQHPREGPE